MHAKTTPSQKRPGPSPKGPAESFSVDHRDRPKTRPYVRPASIPDAWDMAPLYPTLILLSSPPSAYAAPSHGDPRERTAASVQGRLSRAEGVHNQQMTDHWILPRPYVDLRPSRTLGHGSFIPE